MEDMIGIGVMVAIIILASSVHKFVNLKNKASIPSEAENRILARLEELDRRIGDIQEILIALDDRTGENTMARFLLLARSHHHGWISPEELSPSWRVA